MVKADKSALAQVFFNLLVNSIEAMPQGGVITIKTGKEGNFCRVELTDTGSGIRGHDLTHVFEPFFTTKLAGKNSGLRFSLGTSHHRTS